MNKANLINEISKRTGLSKHQSVRFLNSTMEAIIELVASGNRVTLINFGTFEARDRKGWEGKNPATGKPISIPAMTLPAFRAGKGFKIKVNS